MNKKLVAALSGGAALVLTLTGCGGGGDDSGKKRDEWAKQICDQMHPQVKKAKDAFASIVAVRGEEDSKKVQQTDSASFQTISDAYKSLASVVENGGVPPVTDGKTTQENAVKALNDLSGVFAGLKKQVDGLNTSDKAKFSDGLRDLAKKLDSLKGKGDDAINKLQSGELGQAMLKQPSCKKVESPK
ncbi:small secreted protein [Streptomyces luteireticuli]|uniref:Small secreted protein n=1 Tax=Streptomyces luteireticuli TaxID=173858 RepID=A0ABP3I0D1_9ACTN